MLTTPRAFAVLAFVLVPITQAVAQDSTDALKFKVGRGGVTQQQWRVYLQRHAKKVRKRVSSLTAADKTAAQQLAVDDEVLFQAGLAANLHKSANLRRRIIEQYKSNHTTAKINPRSFTAEEIKAYYLANPEEFKSPVELNLWSLNYPSSMGRSERLKVASKAQRDPKSIKIWRRLGWVKDGNAMGAPFSKAELERLYGSRKGKVVGGFRGSMTSHYVFWVKDRKEAKLVPLHQARNKIVHRMIKSKQRQLTSELTKKVGRSSGFGKKTEDVMFDAALKAGVHRQWLIRQRIINEFVHNTKQKRESLLPGLRARYPVAPVR